MFLIALSFNLKLSTFNIISTGFIESTANRVLAKRLVKHQQMQWTKKGAHKR